jgi:hypothetical protein
MPEDEAPEGAGLTRIDRIAKTALITALVLFIVVDQQIVERDSEIARLGLERRRIATHYAATGKTLRELRKTFWERHKTTSTMWSGAKKATKAKLPLRKDEGGAVIQQDKLLRALLADEELAAIVHAALDENALTAYTAALNPSVDKVYVNQEPAFDYAQQRLETAANRSLPGFVPLAEILRKYRSQPAILFAQRQKLDKIAAAVETTTTATQSIPSPFGSFDLNPRLALLFIALATALTYIVLTIGSRRLLRGLPRPGTLPTFAYALSDKKSVFTSSFFGSILLHAAWMALAGWIAIECTRRKAYEVSKFVDGRIAKTSVEIGVIVVIALFVLLVIIVRSKAAAATKTRLASFRPSRRAMLATTGVALAGTAVALAVRKRLAGENPRPRSSYFPQSISSMDTERPSGLVMWGYVRNLKTLTAHDEAICARHLPKEANRGPALRGDRIHRGKEAQVFEALALDFGSRSARIDYLLQAISYAPFSIHLYDRLIRALGTMKRYDEIEPLFDDAIRRTRRVLAGAIAEQHAERGKRPWLEPSGRVRQLTKALEAFRIRKESLPARRESAARRREMRQTKNHKGGN